MEISHDFCPGGNPDPERGRLDLLEMQLALYQKALGHDLPNRMVALQGLARLAELEPGPDTPARIGRLAELARQADENMRTLAELGCLCRKPRPLVTIKLGELVHEAAIEAKVL